MTVGKLIALLMKINPNRIVILSSDSEGNSYKELTGFDMTAAYKKEGYEGKIGLEKLTEEYKKEGYSKEDVLSDGIPAIVFYP